MKVELLSCYCLVEGSVLQLMINHWRVAKFPLTYTAQECAEAYCEIVGWKLLHFCKEDGDLKTYSMRVEMPDDEVSEHTVFDNYYTSL